MPTETPVTCPGAEASTPAEGLVLMVVDSALIRSHTRTWLESRGHQVLEARDLEEALVLMRASAAEPWIAILEAPQARSSEQDPVQALNALRPGLRLLCLPRDPMHPPRGGCVPVR